MPLVGGIKQKARSTSDQPAPEVEPPVKKMRSYATGGRSSSSNMGQFLSSMYLAGRFSAPELQEGASLNLAVQQQI